ncbi:MAG: Rne/Rng family ribonuclease [Pseudomonadota bacterium]
MAKKMLIDATHAEETRVVVVDGNKVEEFDFESENKRQLAGNIYLAKVTRVEPSLQAAFVDYGGNRHGFLAFSEIHPDYYQIPVADREALMEEERAYAEAMRARDEAEEKKRTSSKSKSKAARTSTEDAVETKDIEPEISGMETIDLGADEANGETFDAPEPDQREAESATVEATDAPPEAAAADDDTVAEDAPDEAAPETAETAEDASADKAEAPQDDVDSAVEASTTAERDAEAADAAGADIGTDATEEHTDATEDMDATEDTDADEPQTDEDDDAEPSTETKADAAAKDSSIESVADDDDSEDLRPPRKPRPRRYKIQEVVKVRQIMLVQVVKEERGNKGAALTTYLSLAGRYCVLMPNTARGGGISRKITNAVDRKKLKEIAQEMDVPQGAGLIVRTAGAKRTKTEIKRDYEYLQRLWEQIRELTLQSIAPAKIYEEGDLIKRSIRDLYNRDIDEVYVEGERGYRIAKDFMKMIMPSHSRNVKRYEDALPLFARYQVESYLDGMFNPTVQLKSGGYIVIGVTEALVAIDVNSGRATKEGSIEETALKTNLEAADEISRQLRLRDLAGLIVIDFIDMDERKNNAKVEKMMKDKLKTDRARIQVGRISGFGLMEMSRQRLRPGMIEATTQSCPHCHGTGLIRSDDNLALSVLRQIEEEGVRRRSREVLVKCPVTIANFLMNHKREHIAQIEGRYGLSVRVEADMHLVSPDFSIEKFKTATRVVPAASAPVVSVDSSIMEEVDAESEADVEETETTSADDSTTKPKRRRRRRSRSRSRSKTPEVGADDATAEDGAEVSATTNDADESGSVTDGETVAEAQEADAVVIPTEEADDVAINGQATAPADDLKAIETVTEAEAAETQPEPEPEPAQDVAEAADTVDDSDSAAAEPAPVDVALEEETVSEPEPAQVLAEDPPVPVAPAAAEPDAPPKPKRRGWWSMGGK